MKLTKQGQVIVDKMVDGESLGIKGVAGCGKTTVVLTGVYHVSQTKKVGLVTFTNSVKDELQHRARNLDNVTVTTFHALAMRKLNIKYSNFTKPWEFDKIVKKIILNEVAKLTTMANRSGIKGLSNGGAYILREISSTEYIQGVTSSRFNELLANMSFINDIPKLTLKLIKPLLLKRVDFIHQSIMSKNLMNFDIALAKSLDLNIFEDFGTVVVSEIQDVNITMLAHLKNFKGQLVVEGDENQAIFKFTGGLGTIFHRFNMPLYPLTKSWRNPQSIVSMSQNFLRLSGLEPSDSPNWEGSNNSLELDNTQPTYIIARGNSDLVNHAISSMLEGKAICISSLIQYINKSIKTDTKSTHSKIKKLVYEELLELNKLSVPTSPEIKIQIMLRVSRELRVLGAHKKEDLKKLIENSVKEDSADFVYTTIHKSKGLTFPNVLFIGTLGVDEISDSEKVTYCNLMYTAMTRSSGWFRFSLKMRKTISVFFPKFYQTIKGQFK